jgi:hypothetical protein
MNNETTPTIELTPAELSMIKLKREQEELKQKEAELAFEVKKEKRILEMKSNIEKFQQESIKKNVYLKAQYDTLSPTDKEVYELREVHQTREFEDQTFADHLRTEANTYGKVVIFNEKVLYSYNTISRGKDIDIIAVTHKDDFKLMLNQSYLLKRDIKYVNIKTLIGKIDEIFSKKQLEVKAKKEKEDLLATTENKLKEMFPDYEVKSEKKWNSAGSYYRGNGNGGYESIKSSVKLPNGIEFTFSSNAKGLTLGNVSGLSKFNIVEIMALLNNQKSERTDYSNCINFDDTIK